MREHRTNQAQFAVAARSLADAIDGMVDDTSSESGEAEPADATTIELLVPPEWGDQDLPEGPAGGGVPEASSGEVGDLDTLGRLHRVLHRA